MELQRLFGANVRHHRKAKGWTLEQLAGQVGVSRETIGKIERGVAAPLFETAEKIAVAFGVPAPVLFGADAFPGTGERARLLTEISGTLSRMNEEQLEVSKIVQSRRKIGWQNDRDVENLIRNDIDDFFFEELRGRRSLLIDPSILDAVIDDVLASARVRLAQ